jgi:hypothetical protein
MMISHRLTTAAAIAFACVQLAPCAVDGYISPTHQKFRSSSNSHSIPKQQVGRIAQPDACEPTLFSHPQTDSLRQARQARLERQGLAAKQRSSARVYDPVVDGNQYRAAQSYTYKASPPNEGISGSSYQYAKPASTAFDTKRAARASNYNDFMAEERAAHFYSTQHPSSSYYNRQRPTEIINDEDDDVFLHGYKDPSSIFEAVEADLYSDDVCRSTKAAIHKRGFIDVEVDVDFCP